MQVESNKDGKLKRLKRKSAEDVRLKGPTQHVHKIRKHTSMQKLRVQKKLDKKLSHNMSANHGKLEIGEIDFAKASKLNN